MGREEGELLFNGYWVTGGEDVKVLKMDNGDSYTMMWGTSCNWTVWLKMAQVLIYIEKKQCNRIDGSGIIHWGQKYKKKPLWGWGK